MKILVKFPTRSRRKKFKMVFDRYLLSYRRDVTFLVSYDEDDHTMKDIEDENWDDKHNIIWSKGLSNNKIHACNRDIDKCEDWEILILASDDMIPFMMGWDIRIINEMEKHFPDTDGVLHFNDGFTGDKLNTMCIMGRKYYERFNYIYHPDYISLFSDNEFMEVSRKLKKEKYFKEILFKHEHPINVQFGNDALYRRNDGYYSYDKRTYEKRKSQNFGI